ncbi:MAG: valyl-tRNA synthetase, valyl-tRNA synthetase [Candidatus Parcubacteria bacterium]|jgi:valyl-tRNA synthetase
MNEKFLKPYEPKEVESNIYKFWEDTNFFNPSVCIEKGVTDKNAEYYSIVLPPPNVTGVLHLGHAAMLAIEDAIVRFERMKGKKTLWVPGTDHAAIATQTKVEKLLQKEGIRKYDLGREEFLKRVQQFAQESHDTIATQIKAMGASVDWSREAFTLDRAREKAVHAAFKRMYDDGLIYRKEKVINWDPKGQTVISDDEIVYETRKSILYTFKYSPDFPIAISTTRPETKFGDTAVAVHPSDERYSQYVGQTFDIEFAGEKLSIKIIADEHVEKEFGTGALGVTPAHSQIDYDMSVRHNLPIKQVITEYAKMQTSSELVNGLKVEEARTKTVEWLRENNLLIEEKEMEQNVSTAERTGAIIEPLPKLQWFVDVNKKFKLKQSNLNGISTDQEVSLKELMQHVVSSGQIEILPDRFEKTYFHWIDNLRDWCISRQIWYGHQIPVWYKGEELVVGEDPKDSSYTRDEDTLDTWFSSALWTFSTLGWPEQTEDFLNYHPTNLLETGYDIIFFWVARMILMSTYLLGEIPFKTVYLHGLVRDAKGKKMSKSVGNAVDPIEMIEKYGADAVRMSLLVGVGPGSDMNFSEDKVRAYKKFANKIWNATRFVLEQTSDEDISQPSYTSPEDQARIDEFSTLMQEITREFEEYKLYLVSEKLYHYFWHTFADIIIENSKKRIQNPISDEDTQSAKYLLRYLLTEQLKALHPFMPFITEEIWQTIDKDNTILMVSKWPNQ